MHHPSYTSVESYAVSENFSNYRTKGQKLEKKEGRRKKQHGMRIPELTLRHSCGFADLYLGDNTAIKY
jgi:hypothetical protein